jgi:hypothetical protein
MVAVVPAERVWTPALLPSRVKVTVPVGVAVLWVVLVSVAVTVKDAPGVGVVVEGAMASVVGDLATVMVTGGELALV